MLTKQLTNAKNDNMSKQLLFILNYIVKPCLKWIMGYSSSGDLHVNNFIIVTYR